MTDTTATANAIKLTLSKPIPAYGEDVAELAFREPTGADLAATGMPVSFDLDGDEPKMSFNAKEMSAMLGRLASVPPSSIGKLTAGDWTAAAYLVAPFFMPSMPASSS